MYYTKPAEYFEEALPIGNGSLGAMVYGGVICDKLSLNHDTLWTGKPKRTVLPGAFDAYKKAKKLVLNGKEGEAEDLISNNFNADWSQFYLPLGNLYIQSETNDPGVYERFLDMQNALVSVRFNADDATFCREYLASFPDDVIAVNYRDDIARNYKLFFDSKLKNTVKYYDDNIIINGECPTEMASDSDGNVLCKYDGGGVHFTAIAKVISNGTVSSDRNCITVKNSTEMIIYIAVSTSYIDYNTAPNAETDNACEKKITDAEKKSYQVVKYNHENDFSKIYDRTCMDFANESKLPTDKLILSGKDYAALAELMVNYAKYLTASASRPGSQAMNLQGIWNERLMPPWCSGYTLNINTEMNYWHTLPLDLSDMVEPLDKLAEKIADTGRTTAKEYYNSPGYVSHHVTDIWGMSTACGPKAHKNAAWGFWNMSSAWILNELYKKYEYTQDTEYLKNTLYPMMKELVLFYESMLDDLNGKKIMLMSTSPENRYILNGESQALAKFTAMTQELLIVLFKNFVKTADLLKLDSEFSGRIKNIIPKLDIFDIGSRGQLLEWDREYEENDINHRHVSHLYGVYPGEIFTEKSNKNLYDACRKSLEIRGDDGTGWSIAWKINLWAAFGDGNRSFEVFKNQMLYTESENTDAGKFKNAVTVGARGGVYANLFDAHPPFQIDGNFGAASGIIQWFLQCKDDIIYILPALPDDILNGKIEGIVAKGNIKLSIEWKNGVCTNISAASLISQDAVFNIDGEIINVNFNAGETVKIKTSLAKKTNSGNIFKSDRYKVFVTENIKQNSDTRISLVADGTNNGVQLPNDVYFEYDGLGLGTRTVKTYYSNIEFNDSAMIEVEVPNGADEISVKPHCCEKYVKFKDGKAYIKAEKTMNFYLEPNGDIFGGIHVFLCKKKEIRSCGTNIIVFKSGIYTSDNCEYIKLNEFGAPVIDCIKSNTTVYISNDAIVNASFILDNVKNVRICGSGEISLIGRCHGAENNFLSDRYWGAFRKNAMPNIYIKSGCENIEISDVLLNCEFRGVVIRNSKNIKLNNIKMFTSAENADGINCINTSNMTVDGCYIKSSDDCFCMYNSCDSILWLGNEDYDNPYAVCENVEVKNCIMASNARPFVLGGHATGNKACRCIINDIYIHDCEIIHTPNRIFGNTEEHAMRWSGLMRILSQSEQLVKNIIFENMTFDVTSGHNGKAVHIEVRDGGSASYTEAGGYRIENVRFKNIKIKGNTQDMVKSLVKCGVDSGELYGIYNVVFENFQIGDKYIKTDDIIKIGNVKGVKYD